MFQLLLEKEKEDPSCLFHELFFRQLPCNVRSHLADKRNLDLTASAEEADQFYSMAAVKVAAVRDSSPKQRTGEQSHNCRPGERDRRANEHKCFYHTRFGNKAHRCEHPCSWSEN